MFVRSFGLFWRTDEVIWNPGKGTKGGFRLLGRRGKNHPVLRLADFRHQKGIYILYGNHGALYVGLTKQQGLGNRLKDHLYDSLADRWDRFSWFGFCPVRTSKDCHGLCKLGKMAQIGSAASVITDVEALLIRAMGLSDNILQMKFTRADEWLQVKIDEAKDYLTKIA